MLMFRQLCLGRVAPSPVKGDVDGHNVSQYFLLFFLWLLSLVVFSDSSESEQQWLYPSLCLRTERSQSALH